LHEWSESKADRTNNGLADQVGVLLGDRHSHQLSIGEVISLTGFATLSPPKCESFCEADCFGYPCPAFCFNDIFWPPALR
jgi:hypothetical protein